MLRSGGPGAGRTSPAFVRTHLSCVWTLVVFMLLAKAARDPGCGGQARSGHSALPREGLPGAPGGTRRRNGWLEAALGTRLLRGRRAAQRGEPHRAAGWRPSHSTGVLKEGEGRLVARRRAWLMAAPGTGPRLPPEAPGPTAPAQHLLGLPASWPWGGPGGGGCRLLGGWPHRRPARAGSWPRRGEGGRGADTEEGAGAKPPRPAAGEAGVSLVWFRAPCVWAVAQAAWAAAINGGPAASPRGQPVCVTRRGSSARRTVLHSLSPFICLRSCRARRLPSPCPGPSCAHAPFSRLALCCSPGGSGGPGSC